MWQLSLKTVIIFSFDFSAGLGLIIPQLDIPNLTYLIIKYRTLYIYDKIAELFLYIFSPVVWLYEQLAKFRAFTKAKQDNFKNNKRAKKGSKSYNNYYNDDFKKQQEAEYKKEQAKQDRFYREQQRLEEEKRKKQQQKRNNNSYKQKEEKKSYSRWDSTDPYIILGIKRTSTKQEIKKAYRTLSKIYHPDLSLTDKEKNEEIFKKINWAYGLLK